MRARRSIDGGSVEALHDELVALREENARLREENFRPIAPTAIPARLAMVIATVDGEPSDELSAAWLDLEVLREGLRQAMIDLQSLAVTVEVQLRDLVPVAEIERRVRGERREPIQAHAASL